MTKTQLIERIAKRAPNVPRRELEAMVNAVFELMSGAMLRGERIEIRGFGCFAVRQREAREGRNPKTGAQVKVPARRALAFTVGKELRERLNAEAAADGGPAQASTAPADATAEITAPSAEPLSAPATPAFADGVAPKPGGDVGVSRVAAAPAPRQPRAG